MKTQKDIKEVKKTSFKTKVLSLLAILIGFVGFASAVNATDTFIFGFNATQIMEALPNVAIVIASILAFLNSVIWGFLGLVVGLLVFAMLLKFIGIPMKFADSIANMISGLLKGIKV